MQTDGLWKDFGSGYLEPGHHPAGEERVWSPSDPEKLRNLTDYRQAELDNIICLRKGDSSCRPGSFAKFFWRTDHFVFQRPDFYTSVRMYSTRNANMEEPYNGEGLMNHLEATGQIIFLSGEMNIKD